MIDPDDPLSIFLPDPPPAVDPDDDLPPFTD